MCSRDPCAYARNSDRLILALYVDDGLRTEATTEILEVFLKSLQRSFELTFDKADRFIGMEIIHDRIRKTPKILQAAYMYTERYRAFQNDVEVV